MSHLSCDIEMKAKYLALPLALSVTLSSCNDLLTESPGDFITVENFYNTPSEINAAALAMYALLGDWNFYKIQQHWTFELPSDQGRFHPDEPNVETQAPQFLNWTSTSRDAIEPWKMNYWLIQRANIVVERAAGIQFPNPADQQALVGEGQFMRAFAYFWLVRAYGGVPIYTTLAEQARADKPRATEAEVLDQIIRDATEAAAVLPQRRTGMNVGRATRGAALALLADAHRWRANVIGTNAAADWQAAAAATGTIISEGQYALTPNYLDAFLPGSEHRSEEIFAIQFSGVPWEGIDLIGGIYLARNIPQVDGWAVVVPTVYFYHSYPAGDYRHEVTFRTRACPDGSDDRCAEAEKIDFTPHNFVGYQTRGHPHVWKYRPSDHGRNMWGAGDVNTPMYRYADVLLIRAEALYELGQHGEALQLLNEIRARARRGTGNENRAAPANRTTISKDFIYQERSWELAFELKRWFDLVQRGPDYFVSQLTQNDPLSTQLGNIRPERMRLPIPAEEIAKNPKITQNPGY
jgi:starch-binding outer membrane protein, SusD/RagB family